MPLVKIVPYANVVIAKASEMVMLADADLQKMTMLQSTTSCADHLREAAQTALESSVQSIWSEMRHLTLYIAQGMSGNVAILSEVLCLPDDDNADDDDDAADDDDNEKMDMRRRRHFR